RNCVFSVRQLHRPVADDLPPALRVAVPGGLELRARLEPQADLLLDLAERRVLVALFLVDGFPLREAPVAVPPPGDQYHLQPSRPAPPADPAGCPPDAAQAHPFPAASS